MTKFELAERLGYNPPFQFRNTTNDSEYYLKGIHFPRLIEKIKGFNRFYFSYKDFLSDINEQEIIAPDPILIDTGNLLDKPLFLKDKEGNNTNIKISGKLNKTEGQLDIRQNKILFSFNLKLNKETRYNVKIKYRFNNQKAIELTTYSYSDLSLLSEYLVIKQTPELKTVINKRFNNAFRAVGDDIKSLRWLYENAPNFVLKQRGDNQLLEDLLVLINYDKESWFKDASTAMINLLNGFLNLKLVYDFFNSNSNKLIQLYDVLDGESQNQLCVLLNVLCYAFSTNERQTGITFTIGKNFTLDSNLFLKEGQKVVTIKQSEIVKETQEVNEPGLSSPTRKRVRNVPKLIDQQSSFHPLDLVYLKDQFTGDIQVVCALNVKLLSDQAEWADVIETTVLVFSVITILVSAGTLAAGATGLTAVIAITDIVVSSIDIVAILASARLKETEEGKWLLDNWNVLSAATGFVSLSAALRQGLLKNGPKVYGKLRALKSTNALKLREHLNRLFTSIQVELYFAYKQGFVYCTFVPFPDLPKIIGSTFATKMEKFGVMLTTVPEDVKDIRALYYNGTKIAEGNVKELKKTLKDIFPYGAKEKDVLKSLDNLLKRSKIAEAFIKWADKFDKKFHLHFDGEFKTRSKKGVRELQGSGGHNHLVIDKNIRIGDYLIEPIYDKPFDALISVRYKNGQWIEKQAKSSFFPKNWDEIRVKEEIAYVYEQMIKSGKQYHPNQKVRPYIGSSSDGSFRIKIEFDELGNLTNAHPWLKN